MAPQKVPHKNLLSVILFLIILGGIFYYIFLGPGNFLMTKEALTAVTTNPYQLALKKLQRIETAYQSTIFSDPAILSTFTSLKPFITLPLQIGLVGKENPFEPPATPAELLLQQTPASQ